jgi:universal stress protein F
MFKKILVPIDVDYSGTAAAVFKKAVAISQLSHADIRLVSVMPGFGMPIVASYIPADVIKNAQDNFKATVEKFIAEHCDPSVSYSIRTGKNWEEIVREADEWQADLIVVYHNHRRDINEVFSRSCSQRVSDNANCSVLRLRKVMS